MQVKIDKSIYILGFLLLFVGIQQSCLQDKQKDNTAAGSFQFKEKLSDYGFFKGEQRLLIPREGIIPYQLSTPLFSDYALKDRFIVLPQGASMHYVASGPLDFPDSTIIIKNFAYRNTNDQKIMIETRLLIKDPKDHEWKVMNYLWDETQKDAVKHIRGAQLPITLLNEQNKPLKTTYVVPNTNDCKRCHIKDSKLIPIGPKARNLNFTIKGQQENQLILWANNNQLLNLPDLATVVALPDWTDHKKYSIIERSRAYLDINCAHCHTKGGDAYNTGLFLDYEESDPTRLGVYKAPVSAGGGAGGLDWDIVPGSPEKSILYYRMASAEPGTAMPELARSIIHEEGVDLIKKWIQNMPQHNQKN